MAILPSLCSSFCEIVSRRTKRIAPARPEALGPENSDGRCRMLHGGAADAQSDRCGSVRRRSPRPCRNEAYRCRQSWFTAAATGTRRKAVSTLTPTSRGAREQACVVVGEGCRVRALMRDQAARHGENQHRAPGGARYRARRCRRTLTAGGADYFPPPPTGFFFSRATLIDRTVGLFSWKRRIELAGVLRVDHQAHRATFWARSGGIWPAQPNGIGLRRRRSPHAEMDTKLRQVHCGEHAWFPL